LVVAAGVGGALNYAVSLAYGLAFWIISLVLLAVLMAFRQLAGLQLQVEAGKTFLGHGQLPTVADQSGVGAANPSSGRRGRQHRTLPAAAGGQQSVSIPLLLNRRGPHAYPVLQIWSRPPLA
jgi:hypothetical protein